MQSLSKKKLLIFFSAADNGTRNATLNESFPFCSMTSFFLDVKVINHWVNQQQGSLLITMFSALCNHSKSKRHCKSEYFFKIWNLHFLLPRKFAWNEGRCSDVRSFVLALGVLWVLVTALLSTLLDGQRRKRECEAELIVIELLVNDLALLFLRQSKRKCWFSGSCKVCFFS